MSDCPCQQVLETLELIPESDLSLGPAGWTLHTFSAEIPGLPESWAHYQTCSGCQEAMSRVWQFDRATGTAIRNVPVPSDLISRLVVAAGSGPASRLSRVASRHWMHRFSTTIAAGCLLVAFVAALIAYDRWNRVSVDDITAEMVAAVYNPSLSTVEPRLPLPQSMSFSAMSTSFALPLRACHGEAYYFPVQVRQDAVQKGILVALPLSRVRSAPQCDAYLGCHIDYVGAFIRTAWVEDSTVYVFLIQGDEELLRARSGGNPG